MQFTRLARVATVLGPLVLLGCGPTHDARVPELETKIAALESKLATLETRFSELSQQVNQAEFLRDWEGIAYLTPGSDGYSSIKTDLGTLTVSLKDIQPYANGSRVTLQFGNLTSATIDGLKAKLYWGSIEKDGKRKTTESKSREVTFTQSMVSGAWTNADVVLEGVPPTELGYVTVRDVGHRGVRLRRAGV
jgi:hypothetical protein